MSKKLGFNGEQPLTTDQAFPQAQDSLKDSLSNFDRAMSFLKETVDGPPATIGQAFEALDEVCAHYASRDIRLLWRLSRLPRLPFCPASESVYLITIRNETNGQLIFSAQRNELAELAPVVALWVAEVKCLWARD